MKLSSDERIILVSVGLGLAGVCVYWTVQGFYKGLQQTIMASVHGGAYNVYFLQSMFDHYLWFGSMFASCVLLAIGFMAEKEETSTGA